MNPSPSLKKMDRTTTAAEGRKSVFSHVVLTAPTEKIAEVYRSQLGILKTKLSYLKNSDVSCVPDPHGCRVGSGGGTLNAIDFLQITKDVSFAESKVLIIHSGGDSKRAPLASLCGKAWTTLNAVVDEVNIANPLILLILEISHLFENIQEGSLVVASSDVLLDLCEKREGGEIRGLGSRMPDDAVTIVTVPTAASVAKNHGVLVASEKLLSRIESPLPTVEAAATHEAARVNQGVHLGRAWKYLQKPSVALMKEQGAIVPIFNDCIGSSPTTVGDGALIDTGIIVFTGTATLAMQRLCSLTPTCFTCERSIHSSGSSSDSPTKSVLRLELYSDLLLAVQVESRSQATMDDYYDRLGLKTPSTVTISKSSSGAVPISEDLYNAALPVVWQELHEIPLFALCCMNGKFEHLGTTTEVMELLTAAVPAVTAVEAPAGGAHSFKQNEKLLFFARKYQLEQYVRSCFHRKNTLSFSSSSDVSSLFQGIMVNSIAFGGNEEGEDRSYNQSPTSLIEHCAMEVSQSSVLKLHQGAILSHCCAAICNATILQSHMLMQQIYIKKSTMLAASPYLSLLELELPSVSVPVLDEESCTAAAPSSSTLVQWHSSPFVVMMMQTIDDVKVHYRKETSCLCSVPFTTIFELFDGLLAPSDIWPAHIAEEDRSLWNAQLYSVALYKYTHNGWKDSKSIELYAVQCQSEGEEEEEEESSTPAGGTTATKEAVKTTPCDISNLLWFQKLPAVVADMGDVELLDSLKRIVLGWKSTVRLSVCDVLAVGDADEMLAWRSFLNVPYDVGFGRPLRSNNANPPPPPPPSFLSPLVSGGDISANSQNLTGGSLVPGEAIVSIDMTFSLLNNAESSISKSLNSSLDPSSVSNRKHSHYMSAGLLLSCWSAALLMEDIDCGANTATTGCAQVFRSVISIFAPSLSTGQIDHALRVFQCILDWSTQVSAVGSGLSLLIGEQLKRRYLLSIVVKRNVSHGSSGVAEELPPFREKVESIVSLKCAAARAVLSAICSQQRQQQSMQQRFVIPVEQQARLLFVTSWLLRGSCADPEPTVPGDGSTPKGGQIEAICTIFSQLRLCSKNIYDRALDASGSAGGASLSLRLLQHVGDCLLEGVLKVLEPDIVATLTSSVESNSDATVATLCKEIEATAQFLVSTHVQYSLDKNLSMISDSSIRVGAFEFQHPIPSPLSLPVVAPPRPTAAAAAGAGLGAPMTTHSAIVVPTSSESDASLPPLPAVHAFSPARVDLAGGWSDTPPICYTHKGGGAVFNMSVLVDNQHPIHCIARWIDKPVIKLQTLHRVDQDDDEEEEEESGEDAKRMKATSLRGQCIECADWSDFADVANPTTPCALLMAVLIVLGVAQPPSPLSSQKQKHANCPTRAATMTTDEREAADSCDYLSMLQHARESHTTNEATTSRLCHTYGLEVVSFSSLPAGSGMGGSSIIAGTVLTAVRTLVSKRRIYPQGVQQTSSPTTAPNAACGDADAFSSDGDDEGVTGNAADELLQMVSLVEQVMTCGGGWQDQMGSIYGGLKLGTSSTGLPLKVSVTELHLSPVLKSALEKRMCLVYTGKQRLAKNTLISALMRWALTSSAYSSNGRNTSKSSDMNNNNKKKKGEEEEEEERGLFRDPIGAGTIGIDHSSAGNSNSSSSSGSDTVLKLIHNAKTAYYNMLSCNNDFITNGAKSQSLSDGGDTIANKAIDQLATELNRYWELKKEMAPGSEPTAIGTVLAHLRPLCSAVSLCGAGAGGFAIVILKPENGVADMEKVITEWNLRTTTTSATAAVAAASATTTAGAGTGCPWRHRGKLSLHSVQIDEGGVRAKWVSPLTIGESVTDFLSTVVQ